jgi:L-lactate utilization protein LutC
MTKKFNTQKTNWNKFAQYFKNNYSSIKDRMTRLLINFTSNNLNKRTKLLRNVIVEASNQFISKKRSCENSKIWWTEKLTQLKKNLARAKRMHKVSQTKENLLNFKRNRNNYFQAIQTAKKDSWSNFLNNAVEKKVFQAYIFTKNNRIKKLSSIQYERKTNIEFEDKCNAFIEAMYSVSSDIENTNEKDIRLKLNLESFEWSNLSESKLQKAIFIFASNKASRSNQLTFFIVQKAYNSILDVFFMLYFELINRNYHFACWKEEIEATLKKLSKSDFIASKVYKIITFLHCLNKISKKIIASRLLYFEQISDLLDLNQMSERKKLSAINTVMNLTHDIELSLKKKKAQHACFWTSKKHTITSQ